MTAPTAVEIIAAVKDVHREWTQAQIRGRLDSSRAGIMARSAGRRAAGPGEKGAGSLVAVQVGERARLQSRTQWKPERVFLPIHADILILQHCGRRARPTRRRNRHRRGGRGGRDMGDVDSGLAPPLWTGRSGRCADGDVPKHKGLDGARPRRPDPPATAAPAGPAADRRLACGPRHGLGRGDQPVQWHRSDFNCKSAWPTQASGFICEIETVSAYGDDNVLWDKSTAWL